MFEEIKRLVAELGVEEIKNYRVAKEQRAVLQMIKVESQRLREEINAIWKKLDAEKKAAKVAK